MTLLDTLHALAPTFERENIHGSGFKRLAMLESAVNRDDEQKAIGQMLEHYGAAEKIARSTGVHPFFYPAMNRIAARLALADDAKPLDNDDITAVRGSMSSVPPDFWSVVGQTELDVFVSIAAGTLSQNVSHLIEDFRKHHARVSNPRMWDSIVDNATFVRSRYARHPDENERTAADRLLRELELLAGGVTPMPEESSGIRRAPTSRAKKSGKRIAKANRHSGSPLARHGSSKKNNR